MYADGGHSLDFVSKAFECLDLLGFEHAAGATVSWARWSRRAGATRPPPGGSQSVSWPCSSRRAPSSALFTAGRGKGPWRDHAALAQVVLGDDPAAIVAALEDAIRDGAAPHDLGRAVAYAAALRVARFGTANEFGDWETAHHSFTYCNAVHQGLKRLARRAEASYVEAVRGVFHGAMTVSPRPPTSTSLQRLPGEDGDRLDDLPRGRPRSAVPCSRRSTASSRWAQQRGLVRPAISCSAIRPSTSSPPSPTPCCARTRASTPSRCSRRACASTRNGAQPTRAATS